MLKHRFSALAAIRAVTVDFEQIQSRAWGFGRRRLKPSLVRFGELCSLGQHKTLKYSLRTDDSSRWVTRCPDDSGIWSSQERVV